MTRCASFVVTLDLPPGCPLGQMAALIRGAVRGQGRLGPSTDVPFGPDDLVRAFLPSSVEVRGYDDLEAEILARFARIIDSKEFRDAMGAAAVVRMLERLQPLCSPSIGRKGALDGQTGVSGYGGSGSPETPPTGSAEASRPVGA